MQELSQNIKIIREGFKKVSDKRGKEGKIYTIEDIGLSAFSLFYFQSGTWLNFQRNMARKTGKSNAKSLFGIENIPSDNHIRNILDGIGVDELQPIFDNLYTVLEEKR